MACIPRPSWASPFPVPVRILVPKSAPGISPTMDVPLQGNPREKLLGSIIRPPSGLGAPISDLIMSKIFSDVIMALDRSPSAVTPKSFELWLGDFSHCDATMQAFSGCWNSGTRRGEVHGSTDARYPLANTVPEQTSLKQRLPPPASQIHRGDMGPDFQRLRLETCRSILADRTAHALAKLIWSRVDFCLPQASG